MIIYNHIIYEIIYIPWKNNKIGLPWKYIGSTNRDLSKYFGSVGSKQWKDWWINETKSNPANFEKKIIFVLLSNDHKELLKIENQIQKDNDVVRSDEYFNKSYATQGRNGRPVRGKLNPNYNNKMNDEQRLAHSIIMKQVYLSSELRELQSRIQKEAQSRQDVVAKKRKKQSLIWKELSGNISNSISTQYKPVPVHFNNFSFLSYGNFKKFIKENKLTNHRSIRDKLIDWDIGDYFTFTKIKKYKFLDRIDLKIIIEIAQYCNEINYTIKHNPGSGINNTTIINKFNIRKEDYTIICNFLRRYQNNYKKILEDLLDIKCEIEQSNNTYLKGFLK